MLSHQAGRLERGAIGDQRYLITLFSSDEATETLLLDAHTRKVLPLGNWNILDQDPIHRHRFLIMKKAEETTSARLSIPDVLTGRTLWLIPPVGSWPRLESVLGDFLKLERYKRLLKLKSYPKFVSIWDGQNWFEMEAVQRSGDLPEQVVRTGGGSQVRVEVKRGHEVAELADSAHWAVGRSRSRGQNNTLISLDDPKVRVGLPSAFLHPRVDDWNRLAWSRTRLFREIEPVLAPDLIGYVLSAISPAPYR